MSKYRKKPVVVEAEQFVPAAGMWPVGVEPYYPEQDRECAECGVHVGFPDSHGWVETLEGGHIACVGDWIITGVRGEKYPCKPDIFEATYEAVDDGGER